MRPQKGEVLAELAERGVPTGIPSVAECIEQGVICLIAYARISDTRRGKNETSGITTQHGCMRMRVRRMGPRYRIVRRYIDNDLSSAKNDYRPEYEAMIDDLIRHTTPEGYPVHGVICTEEDRIYRLPDQWQRFVTAFRSHPGRHFYDHAGHQDLYAEGADLRGLINVTVSLGEIRKKKSRTRIWHEGRAMRGIPHVGVRPFGWSPDGRMSNPEEAPLVRKAVEACIAGESWAGIVRIFQESGIPTRSGGPWRGQTIKQIVANPRNAGLRMIDGTVYMDEETGQPKIGDWETICTVAELEQVWTRYRPRIRRTSRDVLPATGEEPRPAVPAERGRSVDKATKYLLSGHLRCGRVRPDTERPCMAKLRGTATNKGIAGYTYTCPPKSEGGCSGVGRSGPETDRRIEELVITKMKERATRATLTEPFTKEGVITELDRKLDALHRKWLAGEITDERYFTASIDIRDHLVRLQMERTAWKKERKAADGPSMDVDHLWRDGMNLGQKRAIIADMFTMIIVNPVGRGRKTGKEQAIQVVWSQGYE